MTYKDPEYMKKYYQKNKERLCKASMQWVKDNPKKYKRIRKNYLLKKTFGITLEEYNQMLEKQNYSCAICGIHQNECDRKLAVDHDHETGEVRGLLCINCNKGLGHFMDCQEYLEIGIMYLRGDV